MFEALGMTNELGLVDPPHDDVVDHVRVAGIEQVRVLRTAGADPGEIVGEEALEQREHTRTAHRE